MSVCGMPSFNCRSEIPLLHSPYQRVIYAPFAFDLKKSPFEFEPTELGGSQYLIFCDCIKKGRLISSFSKCINRPL